ncbi:MAG: beta-galactosidase [Planctomycetota bacterium]
MKFGVAYYPEQWPEERWAADAQMMVEMGIQLVRIGEFAWWRLEPRRERIDTSWLEQAVDVLSDRGLEVMMGTPTAAPPAWLFNRHPNILPLKANGQRWYLGSRSHACINNPAYNKYARRIVSELARTFRGKSIWAWLWAQRDVLL